MGLTPEQVKALIAPKPKAPKQTTRKRLQPYVPAPQLGPLKRYDREMLCENFSYGGTCRAPTHYVIEGKPLCGLHALYVLNNMIHELTEIRRKDLMA